MVLVWWYFVVQASGLQPVYTNRSTDLCLQGGQGTLRLHYSRPDPVQALRGCLGQGRIVDLHLRGSDRSGIPMTARA